MPHNSAASSRLNWRHPSADLNGLVPFRAKDGIWFLRMCRHISNAVYWMVKPSNFTPRCFTPENGRLLNRVLYRRLLGPHSCMELCEEKRDILSFMRDAAHLGCQQSTELTPRPPGRFKWTRSVSRKRRNLVSAHVPSHFNWPLPPTLLPRDGASAVPY